MHACQDLSSVLRLVLLDELDFFPNGTCCSRDSNFMRWDICCLCAETLVRHTDNAAR